MQTAKLTEVSMPAEVVDLIENIARREGVTVAELLYRALNVQPGFAVGRNAGVRRQSPLLP